MRFMIQAIIYTMVLTKVTVGLCWTEAQCLVQLLLAYFFNFCPHIPSFSRALNHGMIIQN